MRYGDFRFRIFVTHLKPKKKITLDKNQNVHSLGHLKFVWMSKSFRDLPILININVFISPEWPTHPNSRNDEVVCYNKNKFLTAQEIITHYYAITGNILSCMLWGILILSG